MADFRLSEFDDDLAHRVHAYARQRHCTLTQWFESAARTELSDVSSQAPMPVRLFGGRDAIHHHKHIQHGNVTIGNFSLLSNWNFVVGKLIELPENFMRGGWAWFLSGVIATLVVVYLNATF